MYYFAYGSNMNLEQMKQRCPDARFLKRSYLKGYKFVYDGHSLTRNGAVANVVKFNKGVVWGALFEADNICIENLDRYEGYPTNYQKKSIEVKDDQDNKYQALIYLRKPQSEGTPSDEYRKIVLKGASDCELPKDYVETFINK